MAKGEPVIIVNGNGNVHATAVCCDIMGNPVTRYYDAAGNRVYGKVIACPFFGPEPRREYYTCSCGFRRMRGGDVGIHRDCK